jgi:hypothetical protein
VPLPEPIDLENVAQEIESLGASQLRELYSRYRVLPIHRRKRKHQRGKQSPGWRATIRTQRREIADLLAQSPGLEPKRQARPRDACGAAREDAAAETGLPQESLPEACPWTLDEVESGAFWPREG